MMVLLRIGIIEWRFIYLCFVEVSSLWRVDGVGLWWSQFIINVLLLMVWLLDVLVVVLLNNMLINLSIIWIGICVSYLLRAIHNFVNNSMFCIDLMTDRDIKLVLCDRLRWLLVSIDDVSRYEGGECL